MRLKNVVANEMIAKEFCVYQQTFVTVLLTECFSGDGPFGKSRVREFSNAFERCGP